MNTLKELKKYLDKMTFKTVIKNLFSFVLAFIFSSTEFLLGSLPFGIAICAGAGKNPTASFFGAFLGAVLYPDFGFPYAVAILVTIVLRTYFSSLKFNEGLVKKLIACAGSSAFLCIEKFILDGFTSVNLLFSLFTIALSIAFTFLYSVYFSPEERFENLSEAGAASLMFTGLYALNQIDIYGFYPSVVLAFLFSIFTCAKFGFMKGGIIGLICGLASGADAAVYAPLIAICAIVFGIIYNFSDIVAICSVLFVSIVYGIYSSNVKTVESIFQNVVLVIIIYVAASFIAKKFGIITDKNKNDIKIYDYAIPTFTNTTAVNDRIEKLSKTYRELSEIFSGMGKHQTEPTPRELCTIIKDALSSVCLSCKNKEKCTERRECLSQVIKLSKKYLQKGRNIPASKAEILPKNCSASLIELINNEYKKLIVYKCENDSCTESANSMMDISRALSSVNDECSDYLPNPEVASKLATALMGLGIENSGVFAQGKRGVTAYVYNVKPTNISIGVKTLARLVSSACKIEFAPPKITYNSNKYNMCFSRKAKIVIDGASSQLSFKDAPICGDSICSFRTPADYYSVICDGMGSGTDAACTSRMSCIMLNKLISGGCSTKVAIDMINKLLLRKFDEVFTTLDILQVDIFTGEANLYKAGSASSLIIRNGKKYELSAKTTPVGIVDKYVSESIKLRLCEGDTIIMFSDGATEAFGNNDNLFAQALGVINKDAQYMCNHLTALAKASKLRRDDITFAVIKIVKTEIKKM